MNVEKEDDEKEMASTEGNTNVEMTTNNDMNTDAAATEPPASTSTSTVENETHPAATATNLEAAPIEEEKMSSKDDDKQEEMKPTRSGCSCQGSCLVHTCSCFVEGNFCDTSICKCCAPATANSEMDRSTTCKNDDNKDNVALRKKALVDAMEMHPDSFWDKEAAASTATAIDSNALIMDTGAVAAEKQPTQELDPKILASIKDLVKQLLLTSGDDMDIDTLSKSSALAYLQASLEKLAKDAKTNCKAATSEDLASTLMHLTSKDILEILGSLERVKEDRNNDSSTVSTSAVESTKKNATVETPNAELQLLQCSEMFPEDDDVASDGCSYYKNLDKKAAMYTSAGNSNDPLVKNLICEENGFFDGDDSSVYEKDKTNESDDIATAEMETIQQLALIQETTRMVRAKTLELAKQRLKRQKVT